jgi:uncharacterized hydrophobic protein (TIGR00341 family)
MPLRMIEVIVARDRRESVEAKFREVHGKDVPLWTADLGRDLVSVRTVVEMEELENLTDAIDKRFNLHGDVRTLVWPVAATIPRLQKPEEDKPGETSEQPPPAPEPAPEAMRRSREELLEHAEDMTGLSRSFLILTAVSIVVAVIGLMRSSSIIVMAAMVIAPLLGPNVALSLATALGDWPLARKGALTGLAGVAMAYVLSVLLGVVLTVDPALPEIASRTSISLDDVALALASGVAGILSFTVGTSEALVGVMVAISLLPPLATSGMLLGAGHPALGLAALVLFGVNIVCLNLAGILTFLFQGVRPSSWWKAAETRKTSLKILLAWTLLLLTLFLGFWLSPLRH